jgi:hypothetical protein
LIVAGLLVSAGGIAAWVALRNLPVEAAVPNQLRPSLAGDSLPLAAN